jgi:hypothetical protein
LKVINREFYNLYKQNRRKTAREIDQYKLFVKAVNGLLITMRDIIEESEGGLHILGIGYFANRKTNKKRKKVGATGFFKRQKREYSYKLDFFPDKQLKDWYITYSQTVSKRERLKRYYLHFDLIESYHNARLFATYLKEVGAAITHAT